jgi:hypothetical protein
VLSLQRLICLQWCGLISSGLVACFPASNVNDAIGKSKQPDLVVTKVIFGSGRAAANITDRFREIVNDKDTITTVNSAGLQVKNPHAYFRDKLKIWYNVDGTSQYLELDNGISVNFFHALINYHQRATGGKERVFIDEALFGSGRGAGNATDRIREIIKDKNSLTTVTSEKLRIKNPSGAFRDKLIIWYRIDTVRRYLEIENGACVQLYHELLEHHAKVNSGELANEADLRDHTFKIKAPEVGIEPVGSSESARHEDPRISVERAIFGTGRAAVNVTNRIREIIKDKNAQTTLSSPGIGVKNPRGQVRDRLKIWYSVDGVKRYLQFQSGVTVNVYQGMLDHHGRVTASEKAIAAEKKDTPNPTNPPASTAKPKSQSQPNQTKTKPKTANQDAVPTESRGMAKDEANDEQTNAPNKNNYQVKQPQTNQEDEKETGVLPIPKQFGEFKFGGNGRYLAMRALSGRLLYVVDTTKRAIVKEINIDGDFTFACSREKLVIISQTTKTIERWDFNSLKRELVQPWKFDSIPNAIEMGDQGDGPLGMWLDGQLQFLDIEKMELVLQKAPTLNSENKQTRLTVSGNGLSFCTYRESDSNVDLLTIKGNETSIAKLSIQNFGGVSVMPSDNGDFVYAANGRLFEFKLAPSGISKPSQSEFFPSGDPRFMFRIARKEIEGFETSLLSSSTLEPIYTIKNAPDVKWHSGYRGPPGVYFQPRLRFLPEKHLLVIVPKISNRIEFRTLNLTKNLEELGKPYLHVISKPNWHADVGEEFKYKIEVLTNSKSVRYSLENAPTGATIDQDGMLTWSIDQRPIGGRVEMVVMINTLNGHQKRYRFPILVGQQQENEQVDTEDDKSGWLDLSIVRDFAAVNESFLELPGKARFLADGLDGRQLMLLDKYLCVFKPDGFTIERIALLDKQYNWIGERQDYFVAVSNADKQVCLIDKKNLQILKITELPFKNVYDLAIHPQQPVSFISGETNSELPTRRIVQFDETSGELADNKNWVGMGMAMDPGGKYLFAVYHDRFNQDTPFFTDEQLTQYMKTKSHLWWLIQYQITDLNQLDAIMVKPGAGKLFGDIEISNDGKRLICLSIDGYPYPTKNNAAWDTSNWQTIPAVYRTSSRGSCEHLAFHPTRSLVVSIDKKSLVFFDRETGDVIPGVVDDSTEFLRQYNVHRAFFSPDGKAVIAVVSISDLYYLVRFRLRSESELSTSVAKKSAVDEKTDGIANPAKTNKAEPETTGESSQDPSPIVNVNDIPVLKGVADGENVTINLPGIFDSFRAGSGGRFLVFHFKNSQTLKILDVFQQTLVKEIVVPDNVLYAVGKNKLVVLSPDSNQLQRWDLNTRQLEATIKIDLEANQPEFIAMGCESDGPLGILGRNAVEFVNVRTMELIKGISVPNSKLNRSRRTGLQVSPNGLVFSAHGNIIDIGTDPGHAAFVPLETPRRIRSENRAASRNSPFVLPNDDRSLKLLFGRALDYNMVDIGIDAFGVSALYPCVDNRYVLSARHNGHNEYELTICTAAHLQSIHTLEPFKLQGNQYSELGWEFVGWEKSFHYYPNLEFILWAPPSRDTVVLRRFSLEKAVAQANKQYLYVTSKPVIHTRVGDSYQYQLQSLASSTVRYSLVGGPPTLTVSDQGLIQWDVQSRPVGGKVFIAVTAKSEEGLAVEQTYELYIDRDVDRGRIVDVKTAWKKPGPNIGFVTIDDFRCELVRKPTDIHKGLDGKMLVLAGRDLIMTKSDGWTVDKVATLDREYTKVCERKDYLVAITSNPPQIFVIDKTSLNVTKSLKVPFFELYDIVLHPTLPFSFVTGNTTTGMPTRRMIRFNELAGEAIENYNWAGKHMVIDNGGQYLYTTYEDRLSHAYPPLMDRKIWAEYPMIGEVGRIIKYKFDDNCEPVFEAMKKDLGLEPVGIELSDDGKYVAYLCTHPRLPNCHIGYSTTDLHGTPVIYETNQRNESPASIRFHPTLPLVVALDGGEPVFYDRESGKLVNGAVVSSLDALDGLKIDHVYFSPDGENVIFVAAVNGVPYLHKYQLKK